MQEQMNHYIVDFSNMKSAHETHEIIAEALDFPDYYGCNWDAFWDCITDMIGMHIHIEIRGLDVLSKTYKRDADLLCECLKEFKHYANDRYIDKIHIDIIQGDNVISLT